MPFSVKKYNEWTGNYFFIGLKAEDGESNN